MTLPISAPIPDYSVAFLKSVQELLGLQLGRVHLAPGHLRLAMNIFLRTLANAGSAAVDDVEAI